MIVRLMGGLGNQMFQYAFGASLSAVRNEKVMFSQHLGGRLYGLGAYPIEVRFADETRIMYNEPSFSFDPNVSNAQPGTTFVGYWQTEKYFNVPLVRSAFVPRNMASDKSLRIAESITHAKTSAFLHVRRTDYTQGSTNAYHGMPTMTYYLAGIENIRKHHEDVRFFIFSDEPEWCKDNFPKEFTVVDHNEKTPHEDIWLMSRCQHAVIANSSFSWWGAWLGDTQQSRLVFAPKTWFLANVDTRDLLPEGWIKL